MHCYDTQWNSALNRRSLIEMHVIQARLGRLFITLMYVVAILGVINSVRTECMPSKLSNYLHKILYASFCRLMWINFRVLNPGIN